jgi:hypothetical protein
MSWLLWRQHRLQAAVAAAAYAAFLVAILFTGWHMAAIYHSALVTCRANGTCDELKLFQGYGAIVDMVNLTAAVPLLIGLFWGVTSVGREMDTGTHVLAWTQSVTRRRWLAGKIGLLMAAATVWAAAVTVAVTWWSKTPNSYYADRFVPGKFMTQGIVPIAYSLFAAALGLAAGAVIRRTLPALAVTMVGYVAAQVTVSNWIRPHLAAPLVSDVPFDQQNAVPSGSWVFRQDIVLHGKAITGALRLPAQCAGDGGGNVRQCLADLGYRYVVHYQPPSRYWPFQWVEFTGFVALAAVLVAVAWFTVLRRGA